MSVKATFLVKKVERLGLTKVAALLQRQIETLSAKLGKLEE